MVSWKKSGFRAKKLFSAEAACAMFFDKYGGEERQHLNAFWMSWEAVMGEEISALGFPLGKNKRVLMVGSEDNMAMQELSMQSLEILERANTFMDSPYFESVKVVLMQGKRPLNMFQPRRSIEAPKPYIGTLPELGGLLGALPPDSPITLCYEAYVRFVEDLKKRV